jgi:hypothetical protein
MLVTSPVSLPAEGASVEQRLVEIGSMPRESCVALSSLWIVSPRAAPS